MKKIELVQGDDSIVYKFKRMNTKGEVITTSPLKMWITFKYSNDFDNVLIQKKLSDNSITYSTTDNYYRFKLLSNDTCDLRPGKYVFDIAIINEKNEKKTLLRNGELIILDHSTRKKNEV